jgi:hypothetical protein
MVNKLKRARSPKAITVDPNVAIESRLPSAYVKPSWSKKVGDLIPIPKKWKEQIILLYRRTSWLMVLLPFVPAGFVLGYLKVNPVAVFAINFVAVFPVAMVNSKAMDLMIDQVGTVKGGLIYMTFG